jgi:SPP1 gp7 family putative phage head morphogenesis protein
MGSPAPALGFTGTNPAAQRAAQRSAGRLIEAITRETLAAIRSVIVSAIREGDASGSAARAIRSMVGLNKRQARAVQAYREELIASGASPDQVAAKVDRYAEKKLRERARAIARTETLAALNEGARDVWRDAAKKGLLSDEAVKEWIVTPDEKLCDICEPLNGQQVKLGEKFDTANGPLDGPPAHPNCRCAQAVTEP